MQLNQNNISNELQQEAAQNLHTIQDLIRWAFTQFSASDIYYGHGTDNPWDEAVALVFQLLSLPSDTPDIIWQSRLTPTEKTLITTSVARRINEKVPVAYLTNKAYFCDSEYYVDERVLVPRSPIGELIENYFSPWVNAENVINILDLCTGSGCIAIACGQYFPDAIVDGGDISADAIAVAEINRTNHQMDNVAFYQSDLFENIPNKKYDIIVSNPPYVDEEDFNEIPQEYLAEPKLGLVSGNDGLDLTRKIISKAKNYLKEEGILIVEVGNSAAALEEAYPEVEFIWLEFQRGGHGVFLLTYSQLQAI